jgi:N-glycosylase/DNA lyase
LAEASIDELRRCGLGYRARLVREAAQMVADGKVDFEQLKKADYEEARAVLLQVSGVGNKVADCVLLFSLEKLEAFPVDVWVRRIVERHYSNHFDTSFIHKISTTNSLSKKAYDDIGSFARGYFGRYAGYAQEYLFHFVRSFDVKG